MENNNFDNGEFFGNDIPDEPTSTPAGEGNTNPEPTMEEPEAPNTEATEEPKPQAEEPTTASSTYAYTKASNPDITSDNATGGVRTTFVPPHSQPGQSFSSNGNPYTGPRPNGAYGSPYSNNGYGYNPNQAQRPPQPPKKPKAPRGRLTGGTIAIVIAIAIVCSSIFGIGGAYLGTKLAKGNSNATLNYAQSSTTVSDAADGSVAAAAEIAVNSVVEITTEIVQKNPFYGQYVQSGAGSGVIIDAENGYIITCAHVIDGASSIKIRLRDGTEFEAKEIGADSQTDIAVVQIDPGDTQLTAAIVGDSDKLQVGQTAIAIGNPLGTLGGTVSCGIISALNRDITIDGQNYSLLQIDTSINPGNSGGGLFDIAGNLIGVVNAKSSGSDSSTTIEGLGFAIPINKAVTVADQLISNGYVGGRASLGIYIMEITENTTSSDLYQSSYPELAKYITDYGVYFVDYSSGQSGDFQFGDRIIAINGTSVSSKSDISSLLQEMSVGDEVEITVSRLNSDKKRSQMVTIKTTLKENVPQSTNTTDK